MHSRFRHWGLAASEYSQENLGLLYKGSYVCKICVFVKGHTGLLSQIFIDLQVTCFWCNSLVE
jgi:hypothetical protein